MLFILTGRIQTGKTRWLQRAVDVLRERGIPVYGVLAPGIWKRDGDVLHKVGITNVLLPSGQSLLFATEGCAEMKSNEHGLAWNILENTINKVNEHFSELTSKRMESVSKMGKGRGMLVVDELGILELLRESGLTEAVKMLELGPCPLVENAIVIVRESLLNTIDSRFNKWGQKVIIRPDDSGWAELEAIL